MVDAVAARDLPREFEADSRRMEVIADRAGLDRANFNEVLTDDSLGANVY